MKLPLIHVEFCGDSDRDMRHLRDAIHKLAHEVHGLIGEIHDLKEQVSSLTDRVGALEARVAVLEAGEEGEQVPGTAVKGEIVFGMPRDM